jgi:protein O-GlcNAc transferase
MITLTGIGYDESAMHVTSVKAQLRCISLLALWQVLALSGLLQEPSAELKQADADYRAGVAALARNDLNAALTDFEHVVHLAPTAEQGHSALGAVLVRLNRTAEGVRELEKALAMKPGDNSAQMNLAMTYEQSGESAKALPLFAKLEAAARAEKKPLDLPLTLAYMRALAATKQFEAAARVMKEAAARNPKDVALQDELGSLYAQQHSWPRAEEAFAAALRIDPGFALAHLHLGLTLQAEKKSGALDELGNAYKLAQKNPVIAVEYGTALGNAGQDARALPVLREARNLDPNSDAAAYQLGLVLQRAGQIDEAIDLLQKAAAGSPQSVEIQINLGMALCQAQRAKDAVPILQRAEAAAPDNATAHQDLAAAYIQLNQLDDAVTELRAALKLSPDAPQLHYNLGLALKMEDDATGAIPELETAQKLNPGAPEPAYVLGVLYMQVGRYAEAARELKASLELRPENGDGWATLGSVYNKLDQLSEAESALRDAIRQLPQQPDPHLTLAAVLAKQNMAAEAAQERKKAAELMRSNMNHQRAEVATNAANSQLKSGNVDAAVEQLREALSYDPNYVEAHRALANALERQGKSIEAAVERQKAEQLKSAQQ